jgi:septal ring factor EnvC (AmiA/AmiB activator)
MLSSQPLFIEPQRCGRITAISSAIQRKPMVLAPDREVEIAAPQVALARASQDAQQSRASQGALRSEIAELRPVMAQAEREANECASAATAFQAEIATLQVGAPRLGKPEGRRSQRSVALPRYRRYLASRVTGVGCHAAFCRPN